MVALSKPKDAIQIPALGQPFKLGMLYDCRTEKLIPGVTLWDNEDLKKDLVCEMRESSSFTIDASDTLEDKANALDIKANLKLSFLGGLFQASGAAKYLDDRTSSFCQERVTMKYSCTTSFESLSMNHLGKGNIKHREVFDHGKATHVVTGIMYGANAFFVFDKMHSNSTWQRDVSGELHAMVKALPAIQIDGNADLKMSEEDKKKADTFKCQFYGDFKPWINPTTYQDAVRLYKDLPQQLGKNNEKAVPVTVWLYPLENLDNKASRLVRDITSNLVNATEMVLENLHECEMKCNDLMESDACQKFYQVKSDIFHFKELMQEYKLSFQNQILPLLPKIRGGGAEESELALVLKQNEESVFSRKQLSIWLESKDSEIKVLSSYLKRMEGISIAPSQADMNAEIFDPGNKFVFVFTMVQPETDPIIENMQAYFRSQCVDASKVKKVLESCSKGMVQNARAFKDFWSANEDNMSTKFLITLAKGPVQETHGFIYIYRDGEIISHDFKPPNQCGTPISSLIRHDSLTLTWTEPNHGFENVTGYEIRYRKVDSPDQSECLDKWSFFFNDLLERQVLTITVPNRSNAFTLPNLQPAKAYEVQIRAMCEYGFGSYSPWSDPILTLPCSPPGRPKGWLDVQSGLNKLEQLQEEIRVVKFHQADIDKNKDFTYTVLNEKVEMGPTDPGTYTTNCLTCKRTCHYPCTRTDDNDKAKCGVMKNGYCRVCPKTCRWEMHKTLQHRYIVNRVLVTKTAANLKARYEDAQGKKLSAEQLITQIREEFEAILLRVIGQTDEIRASPQWLQEIAVKPNPLSTVEYIDILISSEEQEAHPGWRKRVEQYRAARKQVEYMKQLAEEGHDPFKKYKEKIEQEKKSGKGGVWSQIVDSKINPMKWGMFNQEPKQEPKQEPEKSIKRKQYMEKREYGRKKAKR